MLGNAFDWLAGVATQEAMTTLLREPWRVTRLHLWPESRRSLKAAVEAESAAPMTS